MHRLEILGVALELVGERIGGGARQFRRRRLDNRQDQFFAIEGLLKLNVAFAPVEVGRDQRVDVSVDGEMARGIDARCNREHERKDENERSEARTSLNNRDNNICQHVVSFSVLGAGRKRPLSSGVPPPYLMLVLVTFGTLAWK